MATSLILPAAPDLDLERQHDGIVCGIDEVGRGPLAGPVMAVAVVLDPHNIPDGLNDSKALSAKRREALHDLLIHCCHFGVGEASVAEIDQINILQATYLAMQRAVENLPVIPDHALVDGNHLPPLICPATPVIKGDRRSLSIAAASIIAKVKRDFLMKNLAESFPSYGWEQNAGYGTRQHMDALKIVGISPHHRKSFAPIRELMTQES